MDWNRIKTIFILSFLLLDIYLMYQYFESRNANQYEVLTHTSFEERLLADKIEYVSLPKEQIYASYLSAKPKNFKDVSFLDDVGLDVTVYDETTLRAELDEPIKVGENISYNDFGPILRNMVIHGDQYVFWGKNEESNTIIYYQKYDDFTFYKNKNGRLIFYLNDDNEITSYEQTLLEGIEEISAEEQILPAIKAIETIYEQKVLKSDSKITKVELGYYSLIQPASQVLTPTWRFVIDDEENVFVNAFEGQILQLESVLSIDGVTYKWR